MFRGATLRARAPVSLRPAARRTCVLARAQAITVPEARRLLTQKGWSRAWIDGVTERISRNSLTVSADQLAHTLDFLESEGIPAEKVEHMAAMTWQVLARTPEQIAATIAYLQARGIRDVPTVLFQNPKLLEYDVSPDGKELTKGERSRIKVDVFDDGPAQRVLVSFYRTGTTFKASPIAPWQPTAN